MNMQHLLPREKGTRARNAALCAAKKSTLMLQKGLEQRPQHTHRALQRLAVQIEPRPRFQHGEALNAITFKVLHGVLALSENFIHRVFLHQPPT